MKKASDPRHNARILAIQQLFQISFIAFEKLDVEKIAVDDIKEIADASVYDHRLYKRLVKGVKKEKEACDTFITKFAPQWPINQIKKVDLEILRLGIYEAFIGKITPYRVAIDESIELAKEFGGDTSSKFVNGVLGAIVNSLKSELEHTEESKVK